MGKQVDAGFHYGGVAQLVRAHCLDKREVGGSSPLKPI